MVDVCVQAIPTYQGGVCYLAYPRGVPGEMVPWGDLGQIRKRAEALVGAPPAFVLPLVLRQEELEDYVILRAYSGDLYRLGRKRKVPREILVREAFAQESKWARNFNELKLRLALSVAA